MCIVFDPSLSARDHSYLFFEAGVWGYNEWRPTIECLNSLDIPVPMVITAYTLEEALEDADVIEETVFGSAAMALWVPEINPFGSRVVRNVATSPNEYRENQAWQCFMLGSTKRL